MNCDNEKTISVCRADDIVGTSLAGTALGVSSSPEIMGPRLVGELIGQ